MKKEYKNKFIWFLVYSISILGIMLIIFINYFLSRFTLGLQSQSWRIINQNPVEYFLIHYMVSLIVCVIFLVPILILSYKLLCKVEGKGIFIRMLWIYFLIFNVSCIYFNIKEMHYYLSIDLEEIEKKEME
jgi:hypothetical protein